MRLRWTNIGGAWQDGSVGVLRETNVLDSLNNLLFRLIYQDDIVVLAMISTIKVAWIWSPISSLLDTENSKMRSLSN